MVFQHVFVSVEVETLPQN